VQALIGIVLVVPLFLGLGFAQGSSATPGSIRCNAFTKGSNGEPAVLPGVLIVIRGPIGKETELYAKGAFAVDGLAPGIYQIEGNVPDPYAALVVAVSASRSSTVPDEMNVSAVTSTTSPRWTRLKAMDCAFSRKMHRHA